MIGGPASPDYDRAMISRALDLAGEALGRTAPNPPVGAVIARGGAVLGEGHTQPAGFDHAEIVALAQCRRAGHDPRGATLFVTLEPCCHHGRTPPCTTALLEAGIARVVVGVLDPFPPMRGRSVALLRAEGLEVEVGVEREACARRILGFARSVVQGLPEVTLKAAISVDGHIATASGESKWITSEPARALGHRLRDSHDAIVVGIGTALRDDPALTTRLSGERAPHHPVPVVLDSNLRLPASARLLSSPAGAIVITAEDAPSRELPAEILRVKRDADGRISALSALSALAARGLHRVLVEGGGEVHRSLLEGRLVDTLELFVAPMLLPGGRAFVGGRALMRLDEAIGLRLASSARIGPDLHVIYHADHAVPDPLADLAVGG